MVGSSAALALSNARGSDAVGAAAAAAEGLIAAISDDTAQPSRGTESAVRLAAATLRLAAEPATPSTGNAHRHSFDAPADAAAEAVVAWRGRALRVEEQLSSDTHTLQRRVRVAAAAALIAAEALPERLNTPLRALVSTLKQEPDSARRSVAARATARLVIRLLQTGAAPDDAGAAVRQSRAGAKLVSNLCNFIGAGPPQLNVPHSEDRSAGAALDGDNSERYRFAGACATLRACAVAADSENGGPSDARGQLFEVVYPLWERVDALSLAAAGNGALACARDSGAQRVAAATSSCCVASQQRKVSRLLDHHLSQPAVGELNNMALHCFFTTTSLSMGGWSISHEERRCTRAGRCGIHQRRTPP